MQRPLAKEYAEYYHTYVAKVEGDAIDVMESTMNAYLDIIQSEDTDLDHKYGPDKWTIREVMVHVTDTARIFAYRGLCVSRGDQTPLAGFDQNEYIDNNDFSHLGREDLVALWKTSMNSAIALFRNMTDSDAEKMGTASGFPVSARALAYCIAGHNQHHLNILHERYGLA